MKMNVTEKFYDENGKLIALKGTFEQYVDVQNDVRTQCGIRLL